MTNSGHDWRDERIDSEASAKAFLKRELKRLGIHGELYWEVTKYDRYIEYGIQVSANNETACPAFLAKGFIGLFGPNLRIDVFSISAGFSGSEDQTESHRNKHLSLIGLKTLIGIAHEHIGDIHTIELKEVDDDGPRYWAHLGAFPEGGIFSMRYELSRRLETRNEDRYAQLRGTPRDKMLDEALTLAEEFPATALRVLSQIPRANNRWRSDDIDYICRRVFSATCKVGIDEIMALDLKDYSTVKLLRGKLGVLPICPAPDNFSQIAEETAKRNGVTAFRNRRERYRNLEMRLRERYPHRDF